MPETHNGRPCKVEGLTRGRWLISYLDEQPPRSVILTDAQRRAEVVKDERRGPETREVTR